MIDRLGWTLVHFVWEGALVAVLLGLALLSTRRSSPDLRYGFGLGALALMAALPIATFLVLAPSGTAALSSGALRPTLGETIAAGPSTEAKMPLLVGAWCFGVVVLSLRLIGTLCHLKRWQHRHAEQASPEEQSRLDALARRIGLRQRVTLLVSTRIDVPSAWGLVRPVVVVPLGLLTGLPPTQLEGILLHELAHVRRHDYLVNLLQGIVETVLFYHPAVWWVSSVVRREREHLCDDLAVAVLGDPMPYARALLHLEERRQAPRPALSAKEGNLMNRIARVLSPKPAPARFAPLTPSLAALAVASLALGGALRAEAQTNKPLGKKSVKGQAGKNVDRKPSRKSIDWTPSLDPSTGRWRDARRGIVTLSVPEARVQSAASSLLVGKPALAEPPVIDAKRSGGTAVSVPVRAFPPVPTVPLQEPSGGPERRSTTIPPPAAPPAETEVPRTKAQDRMPAAPASPEQSIEVAGRVDAPSAARSPEAESFIVSGQADAEHRAKLITGVAAQAQGNAAQGDAATKAKQDAARAKSAVELDRAIAQGRAAGDRARAELDRVFVQNKGQNPFKNEGKSYRFLVPKTFVLPKEIQGLNQYPKSPLFTNPSVLRQFGRGNDVEVFTLFGEPRIELNAAGKVTLDARDSSFVSIVRALARKAKLSVVIAKGSYADVSLILSERSAADALSILCKAAGATCRSEGGVYYIAPEKNAKVLSTPKSSDDNALVFDGASVGYDVVIQEGRPVVPPSFGAAVRADVQVWGRVSPVEARKV